MWNLKYDTNECIYETETDTDVENKCTDTKGGRGGGMDWEIGIDICTLLYIKEITNENPLLAQGTLLNALWGPKWGGNPKNRGYMYTYS